MEGSGQILSPAALFPSKRISVRAGYEVGGSRNGSGRCGIAKYLLDACLESNYVSSDIKSFAKTPQLSPILSTFKIIIIIIMIMKLKPAVNEIATLY
jgi:hypothetical protein